MPAEKKFMIISLVISIITIIVEIGFMIAGNGLGAGLCLAFGLFGGGLFRFLDEMEGGYSMARYIDADKLTEEYIKLEYSDQSMGIVCNRYASEIARIAKQPTADVVEVVRCKDCKYFTIDDGDVLGVCDCARIARNNGGEIYPVEEHFCSYGKKKGM